MQLNKYLAHAGITSRRKAVDLIKMGHVSVNGITIKNPSFRVSEDDEVRIDDKIIKYEKKIYILLNKPRGYVTTVSDEAGRPTVIDLIKSKIKERLYPVGRLDQDTTGLLVLTNDGMLAHRLAHPRYEVEKKYYAVLDRPLNVEDSAKIKEGVYLRDGIVRIDKLGFVPHKHRNHLFVTLHSGKNRVIRRLFQALSYSVVKLDRISYAGLTKQGLRVGAWRFLTSKEVSYLCRQS